MNERKEGGNEVAARGAQEEEEDLRMDKEEEAARRRREVREEEKEEGGETDQSITIYPDDIYVENEICRISGAYDREGQRVFVLTVKGQAIPVQKPDGAIIVPLSPQENPDGEARPELDIILDTVELEDIAKAIKSITILDGKKL